MNEENVEALLSEDSVILVDAQKLLPLFSHCFMGSCLKPIISSSTKLSGEKLFIFS